jgi:hypothetical protein
MTRHAVVESPVGPLLLVERDGRLTGLYTDGQRHLPDAASFGPRDDDVLTEAREQLTAYFAGELRDFDLPLAPLGTPFQVDVWEALRRVPYGRTCTYGELAAAVGRPHRGAGRRGGQRAQPDLDRGPLPPGGRRERAAHRLRRRGGPEGRPAVARAGQHPVLSRAG